jgi:hypothetical protein
MIPHHIIEDQPQPGFWITHLQGVIYVKAWTQQEARYLAIQRGYQVTDSLAPRAVPWERLRRRV